ncbi:F0F1 ATP synthase subunit B [Alkalicaulis satelles]|uniref:ATP synthase subunit b n=1 Tax=Alkalicaulis satelles TaxID=2609175 RepID=A0A5M6ZPR6_9PROT|nr:F0F1 ATP synthase subunit B [Alkalicaulis satelles]KAA5805248.1 F0F1 ATP synthase subunit B [Alkalicaulis satelles]
MSYLLGDTSFWALIGLIGFFAIVFYMGAHKAVGKALDDRAEKIRGELDEARRLREEAQEMLASYERKHAEAAEEAEQIIKKARSEAEYLREQAQAEIAERIERRTALAEQRIAQAQAQAAKEVKTLAADLAVDAARELLSGGLTKPQRTKLLKAGIEDAKERLN